VNRHFIGWINGILLLTDAIHDQLTDPQQIQKEQICKTLFQHTIVEAIKEKLIIDLDNVAPVHTAILQHVITQCIAEQLPKLNMHDAHNR
jgi:hypothetical protein